MTTKHTETPWAITHGTQNGWEIHLPNSRNSVICIEAWHGEVHLVQRPELQEQFKADGDFIVKAVNSHQALVDALKWIADAHVPDQPAASDVSEDVWVRQWVGRLRKTALDALKQEGVE